MKRWTSLPTGRTLEGSDLAPSMKLEGTTVEQKYRSQLDGFHEETTVRL